MKLRVWPHFIFVLLALNFTVVGITVFVATSDPSFAVVPDYYTKAVEWDVQKEKQLASDALGWHVHAAAIPSGSAMSIRVIVSDKDSKPIGDAKVTADVFHSKFPGQRATVELTSSIDGGYEVPVPTPHIGEWNIELRIERDDHTYLGSHAVYIPRTLRDSTP